MTGGGGGGDGKTGGGGGEGTTGGGGGEGITGGGGGGGGPGGPSSDTPDSSTTLDQRAATSAGVALWRIAQPNSCQQQNLPTTTGFATTCLLSVGCCVVPCSQLTSVSLLVAAFRTHHTLARIDWGL